MSICDFSISFIAYCFSLGDLFIEKVSFVCQYAFFVLRGAKGSQAKKKIVLYTCIRVWLSDSFLC